MIIIVSGQNTSLFSGIEALITETAMLNPDRHYLPIAVPVLDHTPDFDRYRQCAKQERANAINAALLGLWQRLRNAGSLKERDARFWTA